MRLAWLLVFCSAVSFAQDVREIVLRSLAQTERNAKIARAYTYIERKQIRDLDDSGKNAASHSTTYDVGMLEGTPYHRLIARNDKPLPPSEESKEQDKLTASLAERQKESDAARVRRIAEWERKRREWIEPLKEIPDAFNMRLVGQETVNGEDTWVIEASPRPGYQPKGGLARFFPKVKGRFWISKRDYAWVKVDAEVLDTISYGLFLARLQKGSTLRFEQTKVNGEVWVPTLLEANAALRLVLFKSMHTGYEVTYKDYRKFDVESHLVNFHELPERRP